MMHECNRSFALEVSILGAATPVQAQGRGHPLSSTGQGLR